MATSFPGLRWALIAAAIMAVSWFLPNEANSLAQRPMDAGAVTPTPHIVNLPVVLRYLDAC